MNFTTKKLIAVLAVFLCATLANAQTAVTADDDIILSVEIETLAYIDVKPKTGSGTWWVWSPASRTTQTQTEPILIGTVLVETNMPQWDVTIKSPNAGALKNGTTTLKAYIGTTTASDAKIQIYTCIDKTTGTTPCTLTGVSNTTGKMDALTAAGTGIAKTLGKTNGFTSADMAPAGASPVTTGGTSASKKASFAHIGIYAGLFGGNSAVSATDLIGTGTFSETLSFTLVSKY